MWKNIAPKIVRQRMIIEGKPGFLITDKHIKTYLTKLSVALKMKSLVKPVTHRSEKFGWAGWIHWETSGCHFYAWEKPYLFFSSDIYTCKKFSEKGAVKFTKNFFKVTEKDLVFKSA